MLPLTQTLLVSALVLAVLTLAGVHLSLLASCLVVVAILYEGVRVLAQAPGGSKEFYDVQVRQRTPIGDNPDDAG